MDPEVLTAFEQEPVRQVLERVQRNPEHALYYLYVVADDQRLVGVVNMRELMGARPDAFARVRLHAPRRVHCRQRYLANRGGAPSVGQRPRAARGGHSGPVRRCPPLRNRAGFGATTSERLHLTDSGLQTASALGEVFGLGLRGIFQWPASVPIDRRSWLGQARVVMEQPTPHQVLIQRFVELHPEEVARQLDDAEVAEAVGVLQGVDDASRGNRLAADGAT